MGRRPRENQYVERLNRPLGGSRLLALSGRFLEDPVTPLEQRLACAQRRRVGSVATANEPVPPDAIPLHEKPEATSTELGAKR